MFAGRGDSGGGEESGRQADDIQVEVGSCSWRGEGGSEMENLLKLLSTYHGRA